MIQEKELTLKEVQNEIIKLQNKLELYLTKKKINFEKTQPGSTKLKDVVTSKTNIVFDSFTSYMIKDEECDDIIYSLKESIAAYELYFAKEVKRMKEHDDLPLIIYLKEDCDWSWRMIDKALYKGEDYSRTKYRRYRGIISKK